MPRVLIPGGAGFLGSHVAAALVEHPGVDLVVAGDVRRPEHPIEGVVYDECDVTQSGPLLPLLERHDIDVVVHLAAIVNPGRDHDMEYRVDVDGSRNVLDACLAAGVRRVVVSSSGAAYVNLVGHSQGGLDLRKAAKLLYTNKGRNVVKYGISD